MRRPRASGKSHSLLQRVSAIDLPVFVANGDSDPMIPPRYSYLLTGLLPDVRLKIYLDSAHGSLFQHHSEFAADVRLPRRSPAPGSAAWPGMGQVTAARRLGVG